MSKLNQSLKTVLDSILQSERKDVLIFNSQEELVSYISNLQLFQIENAEINFYLDVKSILTQIQIKITNIKITNCRINNGISFYETTIEDNLYFWENVCCGIDFSYCTVRGNAYFSNSVFMGDISFDNAVFQSDTFFWGTEFNDSVSFRSCSFLQRIDFWCSIFHNSSDFNSSHFYMESDFSNCEFHHEALFNSTIWGDVRNEGNKIYFNSSKFNGILSFKNSNFKTELSIKESDGAMNELNFEQVSFYSPVIVYKSKFGRLNFVYSHIYSPIYLTTSYESKVIYIDFSNIWLNSLLSVEPSELDEPHVHSCIGLNIDKAIVSKDGIIHFKGLNLTEIPLTMNGCIINGIIAINNSHVNALSIQNSAIIGNIVLKSEIGIIDLFNSFPSGNIITSSTECITPKNRETAAILRYEKEKQGDVILALKYKQIEMTIYDSYIHKFKIKSFMENFEERIIVRLNYLSNNFGQSWIRAIMFTLTVGFLFTILLNIVSHNVSIFGNLKDIIFLRSSFWKEMIDFIWLPSTSIDSAYQNSILYLIFYLIGKIFVAYGLVQTVISFRKYSKA